MGLISRISNKIGIEVYWNGISNMDTYSEVRIVVWIDAPNCDMGMTWTTDWAKT